MTSHETSENRTAWLSLWPLSFGIAIIAAPYILIFKAHSSAAMIAVFIIGACIVTAVELWRCGIIKSRPQKLDLVEIPSGFRGLGAYDHLIGIEITPRKRIPKEQLALFPGFADATPRSECRLLTDDKGAQVPVLNCEKYSALLLAYLLDHIDETTEKALATGLRRFGKMSEITNSDLYVFVHDRAVREAIKSDFRGNLATSVAKGGEKILTDILKKIQQGETEFMLASMEVSATGKKKLKVLKNK